MSELVETDIQVSVDLGIEGVADYTDILSNLIALYTNPWFLMSIAMTFGAGMLTYLALKTYKSKNIWVTNLFIIMGVELVLGYLFTLILVRHPDVFRYAAITGFNAAAFYWIMDYASYRFKLVRIRAWLHLKTVIKNEAGEDIMGKTLKFKAKRPK